MTENRSGLQKKVSSIFAGAPIPNAGEKPQPSIVPLLADRGNPQPVKEEKKNGMTVNLIRFRKNGEQRVFPLPSTATLMGRRRNCDLRIPVSIVSRKHCQICCDDGTLKIRDLGSRNGTLLNGIRVDEALIQPGDWVQIGPVGFVFQINGQPEKVIAPPVKKAEPAKPKKAKVEKKAEKKTAGLTGEEDFDSLDAADVTSIIDGGLDVKESSGAADILIDDSELLKDGADLKLDDLG